MPRIREPDHRLRLLKLLYHHQQLSRPQLVELTGYSSFLVSKLSDKLKSEGVICEVGSGDSTGGRRPTILSLKPGLGLLLGVHFGASNALLVLTDLVGNVIGFEKAVSRVREGPDVALPHLASLIERVLSNANVAAGQLDGIGLGISGILDRTSGTTLSWPKVPQWRDVPVRSFVRKHFPTLVEVEDTPRTMALAERRFGSAKAVREFVYVMLGAGVGAALFLGGQLYTGKDGFAGEFGHMTIIEKGALCGCGNRGCLETLVSSSALIQRAQAGLSSGLSSQLWELCQGDPSKISVPLVVKASNHQDRFSLQLLKEAGEHLGNALIGLIHLLNPELIVLGGRVASAAGELVLPGINRLIQERALDRSARSVRIEMSGLEEVHWALGASLLVTDTVLESLLSDKETIAVKTDRKQQRV